MHRNYTARQRWKLLWCVCTCFPDISCIYLKIQTKHSGMPNASFCKPSSPTLPEEFRTWNIHNRSTMGDFTKFHPWRSPGRAPVADPCGVAGGYLDHSGGTPPPIGSKRGDLGSKLPPLAGVNTIWFSGHAEEVGFMLGANHVSIDDVRLPVCFALPAGFTDHLAIY